jgi:ankyrin repeat protein
MMRNKRIGRAGVAIALIGTLTVSMPAQAQFSESYKFLEAVRKKEGDKVVDALSVPGSTMVNTRDSSSGQTALHIVTQLRDLTWMRFFLAKGSNPNARDFKGVTALELAVALGFVEGVQLLLTSGARVDEADQTGETSLIRAVHQRDAQLVRVLLTAGANPDRPDNSGRSARDYAHADGTSNPATSEIDNAKAHSGKGAAPGKSYGPTL